MGPEALNPKPRECVWGGGTTQNPKHYPPLHHIQLVFVI